MVIFSETGSEFPVNDEVQGEGSVVTRYILSSVIPFLWDRILIPDLKNVANSEP